MKRANKDKKTMADASLSQKKHSFVLDDRSLEQRLKVLKEYCALVPFKSDAGSATLANVFFPTQGKQIAELAQLYANPEQVDGAMLPHQALLLAFFRMLETPRALFNELPEAHKQLYYSKLLGLQERPAQADRVAVSFILNDNTSELMLAEGLLLDAGADAVGAPRQYRLEQTLLANLGRLTDIRWCAFSRRSEARETRIVCDESQGLSWPEQGCHLFSFDEQKTHELQIGRVVSSEVLAAPGSLRRITVEFGGEPNAMHCAVSKGQTWQELKEEKQSPPEIPQLFTGQSITWIDDSLEMTEAPNGLDGFIDKAPLLKFYHQSNAAVIPVVKSIKMEVKKASDILFSTDEAQFDIDQRIFPFGPEPGVGMGCYLITKDWFNKPNVKITLTPEWVDLPTTSFPAWYKKYPNEPADNDAFKVDIALVRNGVRKELETGASLFQKGVGTTAPVGNAITFTLSKELEIGITSDWTDELEDETDLRKYPAWIEITLKQNFLHKAYWAALPGLKPEETLNPPYTPQWKSLRVDYEVTDTEVHTQYLLTPFGHRSATQTEDAAKDKAQLYLGFQDIKPGQDFHLHWQLQSLQALVPKWEYLQADSSWVNLEAHVRDETQGLFETGLWHAVLPHDASRTASAMPAGRYWIRAVVDDLVEAFTPEENAGSTEMRYSGSPYPYLFGLHTNSAIAILKNLADVDTSHFEQALPAKTITQTAQNIEGLSKVLQPWPSTGGRPAEKTEQFTERAAKYLSHRQRAVSWRDVKTILLDQFPEIYDVRIPERSEHLDANDVQTITMIPTYGKADNGDMLKPKFGPAHLARMQTYLQSVSSPWFHVKLSNPSYRTVQVVYQVEFKAGFNADYGDKALSDALNRHYMPWVWEAGSAVRLGYHLYYYKVLALIQQQPYVDYVKFLKLDGKQNSIICATTEVLILETTPAAAAA